MAVGIVVGVGVGDCMGVAVGVGDCMNVGVGESANVGVGTAVPDAVTAVDLTGNPGPETFVTTR